MSYDQERQDIEQFFVANYTLPPSVDLFFENTPIPQNNEQPYIKLLVRDGTAFQASLGGQVNVKRNNGFVVCEIRHTQDIGTGNALRMADDIAAVFDSEQFGTNRITMLVPTVDRIGNRDGWYQVNVLTEFRRDVIQ